LGPKSIRVNAIRPGIVDTEGARASGMDSGMQEQVRSQTPLGRLGQPIDVAGAAVFLASADSSWITGETLIIAGGLR
jgi:3-oxoacyl-[acyl-carrier protein] reductase